MTRNITRWLLVGLMCLALWPGAARAQSDALKEAFRQGVALYKAGRYGEALPFTRSALELGERRFGPKHPGTAKFLNNLAELYHTQGRYADAEPLYKRALAIYEKALGPDHPDVGLILSNLSELYRSQGRHAAAKPLYERSLEILWRSGRKSVARSASARHSASLPGLL